jgi:hypothetical protein
MSLTTVFWIADWWERHKTAFAILMQEAERAKEKYGYCITATKGLKAGETRGTF